MSMSLSQSIAQHQEMTLRQIISSGKLLMFPIKALDQVIESIEKDPMHFEEFIKEWRFYDPSKTVQAYFGEIVRKERQNSENGGLVPFPNPSALETILEGVKITLTPDIKYAAVKNHLSEIEYSKGFIAPMTMKLDIIPNSAALTKRLYYQLISHRNWTTGKLREVYENLRERQNDFIQTLDLVQLLPYSQDRLAKDLNLSPSTISRLIDNRYIEIKPLEGDNQIHEIGNLVQHSSNLQRNIMLYKINKCLLTEFERKKAYSDYEISDMLGNVARRTITKGRIENNIPNSSERNKAYKIGIETPYQVSITPRGNFVVIKK